METLLHEFYKDEDILVQYEIYENLANIHVHINNWTPSVARRSYRVFASLEQFCKDKNLRMVSFSPNKKFCQLFGGKVLQSFTVNEIKYEVVQWD